MPNLLPEAEASGAFPSSDVKFSCKDLAPGHTSHHTLPRPVLPPELLKGRRTAAEGTEPGHLSPTYYKRLQEERHPPCVREECGLLEGFPGLLGHVLKSPAGHTFREARSHPWAWALGGVSCVHMRAPASPPATRCASCRWRWLCLPLAGRKVFKYLPASILHSSNIINKQQKVISSPRFVSCQKDARDGENVTGRSCDIDRRSRQHLQLSGLRSNERAARQPPERPPPRAGAELTHGTRVPSRVPKNSGR